MGRWREPQPVDVPERLRDYLGGHPLVGERLARRGITTVEAARAFLDPDAYTPTSPDALPGMDDAVARLQRAIRDGERIGVWGDFDVDGQTATALLVSALRELGADVIYHIPNRFDEGHGVSVDFLRHFINRDGAALVLTCDTGIAANEAVEFATAAGVDVVITDHHNLPETLPDAHAILNPKLLPEGHPLRDLPGVGVAYKLTQALFGDRDTGTFLDLVALGIVADVAYQSGDTRYLLQRGLDALRRTERPGLQAMLELADLRTDELSEQHIGFVLGPRLNALGRLDDANPAVELLTSDDLERVRILANRLEGLNAQRKLLGNQVYGGAQAQIERDPSLLDHAALVLSHPQWHTGVVGIVASRLVDDYNRPVILIATPEDGVGRGSARSVEGVDITGAIAAYADLLRGYGGHTMAAGLSIDAGRIPDFRRALSRTVSEMLGERETTPALQIDGYVALEDVTLDLVQDVERLAPFGPGNPPLTLVTADLRLQRQSTIGRRGEHLRLVVEDDAGTTQNVIWWRGDETNLPAGRFDLAYTVRASNYRGQSDVLVEWLDARPAATAGDIDETYRPSTTLIDQRDAPDPAAALRRFLADHDDAVIWCEADERIEGGLDREGLRPAETLIVWTPPPDPATWRAALERAEPRTVALLGVDSELDSPEAFLKRLAGLVKYALGAKDGAVTLEALAAATAGRTATVRFGLRWLAARGQINIQKGDDGDYTLAAGGAEDPAAAAAALEQLKASLRETAAYRAYWLRADNPLELA